MSGSTAGTVTVLQPGEGEASPVGPGIGVVFKIDGQDTGGAVSIVEQPFEVGALVPAHIHTREDEVSIVLEGQVGFRSEDQEVVLGPGGYIVKPRGEVHAMWNAGKSPARIIEVITPAGFEGGMREVAAMAAAGPPDPEALGALAARYGMSFEEPEWLPDVIARYDLTPPPSM
ncbi:MAG: cupin domain-containing protein [bacterium]